MKKIKLTLKQKIKLYVKIYANIDRIKCIFGFHKYIDMFSTYDKSGKACIVCGIEILNNNENE